jgi:hypothetical protein
MKGRETNKYVRSMSVWLVTGGSGERGRERERERERCWLFAKKAARLLDCYFQSPGSEFRDMY